MRVEAALLQRTAPESNSADDPASNKGYGSILKGYNTLFEKKYRERTMIGIMTMFFQRA